MTQARKEEAPAVEANAEAGAEEEGEQVGEEEAGQHPGGGPLPLLGLGTPAVL